METLSFKTTKEESAAISRIVKRARKMRPDYDQMSAIMDLTACHANGCPLDFAKLETADDFNFSHDVFGIARHIDRDTGKLTGFFQPRCAAR
jgi:hypothetical protein